MCGESGVLIEKIEQWSWRSRTTAARVEVFKDWVNGAWVDINTDIMYAEEAEAVSQAVMTSSGQTVGVQSQKGTSVDAKIGPVGEKARIEMRFTCDAIYTAQVHF